MTQDSKFPITIVLGLLIATMIATVLAIRSELRCRELGQRLELLSQRLTESNDEVSKLLTSSMAATNSMERIDAHLARHEMAIECLRDRAPQAISAQAAGAPEGSGVQTLDQMPAEIRTAVDPNTLFYRTADGRLLQLWLRDSSGRTRQLTEAERALAEEVFLAQEVIDAERDRYLQEQRDLEDFREFATGDTAAFSAYLSTLESHRLEYSDSSVRVYDLTQFRARTDIAELERRKLEVITEELGFRGFGLSYIHEPSTLGER
ncbi:MAG: hypothetical protein KDC38_04145 [Planctomycetes bacterium]|nr:hypothetical protein [Planctomycetota bacterium]